jgi:hypothetical protein
MMVRWWPSFQAELVTEGEPAVAHSGNRATAMPSRPALRGPAATLTPGERAWLDNAGIDWDGEAPGEDEPAA